MDGEIGDGAVGEMQLAVEKAHQATRSVVAQ